MSLPIYQQDRLLDEAARRAIPLDVSLELTHHCNFRCRHCYIPDFDAPDLLTTERLRELLAELAEMGTLFLTLTGGELFLRRDWFTVARRARDLGFALRLFTNGFLIDEGIAERVASLSATVEVSLYAMHRQSFEEITQRRGSFVRTLRGIELLRARQIPVVLKTPVMTGNVGELDAIGDYAERIGAEWQAFPTLVAKRDGDPEPLALRLPPADLAAYFGGPHSGCHLPPSTSGDPRTGDPRTGDPHTGDPHIGDPRTGNPRRDGPMCAAASRYCAITSAGDVLACNILPGSGGSVRDRSFREVWESSPWLEEIRGIRCSDLHTCNTCDHLATCGRCHAQALVEDGDLYGPSSWAGRQAELLEEPVGTDRA